jgi:hypothetical protein
LLIDFCKKQKASQILLLQKIRWKMRRIKTSLPSHQLKKNDFDPLEVYNAAYLDLSKGNHQLALQGFQ